jgi:hypothetical protein
VTPDDLAALDALLVELRVRLIARLCAALPEAPEGTICTTVSDVLAPLREAVWRAAARE